MTRSLRLNRMLAGSGGVASVGAGALVIAASWVRWGDSCGPGFDNTACIDAQDHRSEILALGNPWEPIGNSAELAGLGYVLLAVGLALAFAALPSPAWARVLQATLVGSVLGMGVITLLSLQAGESIGFEWVGLPWLMSPILLPTVLLEGFMDSRPDAVMPPWAWGTWAGLLILAHPVVEYILTAIVVGYEPFDSTPWDGMISGGAFVGAGLFVFGWAVARRRVPAHR